MGKKTTNRNSDPEVYYYALWFRAESNIEFDHITVRMFLEEPTDAALESACDSWASSFTDMPDDAKYGWKRVTELPVSHSDAINRLEIYCKREQLWTRRRKMMSCLLRLPPFNGERLLEIARNRKRLHAIRQINDTYGEKKG